MSPRYVIEEQVSPSGAWEPANIPESPWTDDRVHALAILRALGSRRFRVRDTAAVQTLVAPNQRPIYVARSRDRGTGPNARRAVRGRSRGIALGGLG